MNFWRRKGFIIIWYVCKMCKKNVSLHNKLSFKRYNRSYMRNGLLIISAFFLSVGLIGAQIVVENNTLPQVNDTLRTHIDPNPDVDFDASPVENGEWIFNNMSAPTTIETIFRDPSAGTSGSFPEATSVTLTPQGTEFYYKTVANGLQELGLFGQDPILGALQLDGKYSQALFVRRAPLQYGADFSQTTGLFFPIPFSIIPDSLLETLPIQPDSLRLNINVSRNDVVDAWGTLEVNQSRFDVLRERREEIRRIGIEALLPLVGWTDVTDLVAELLPGTGIGTPDTIVSYNFFNDVEIEPIAVVNVDEEDNPISIEYIADEVTTSAPDMRKTDMSVIAAPNPGIGILEFRFEGAPADRYTVKIRNLVGQQLWKEDIYVDGKGRLPADLTHLNRGTYFYTVFDSSGNPLMTRRVVFIRA